MDKAWPRKSTVAPLFLGEGYATFALVSALWVTADTVYICNDTVSIFPVWVGLTGCRQCISNYYYFFLSFFPSFSLSLSPSLSLPKTVLVYTHIRIIFAHEPHLFPIFVCLFYSRIRHCSNWYWPVVRIATHFSVCLAEWSVCEISWRVRWWQAVFFFSVGGCEATAKAFRPHVPEIWSW